MKFNTRYETAYLSKFVNVRLHDGGLAAMYCYDGENSLALALPRKQASLHFAPVNRFKLMKIETFSNFTNNNA
jgi:hypothetical protein